MMRSDGSDDIRRQLRCDVSTADVKMPVPYRSVLCHPVQIIMHPSLLHPSNTGQVYIPKISNTRDLRGKLRPPTPSYTTTCTQMSN